MPPSPRRTGLTSQWQHLLRKRSGPLPTILPQKRAFDVMCVICAFFFLVSPFASTRVLQKAILGKIIRRNISTFPFLRFAWYIDEDGNKEEGVQISLFRGTKVQMLNASKQQWQALRRDMFRIFKPTYSRSLANSYRGALSCESPFERFVLLHAAFGLPYIGRYNAAR